MKEASCNRVYIKATRSRQVYDTRLRASLSLSRVIRLLLTYTLGYIELMHQIARIVLTVFIPRAISSD